MTSTVPHTRTGQEGAQHQAAYRSLPRARQALRSPSGALSPRNSEDHQLLRLGGEAAGAVGVRSEVTLTGDPPSRPVVQPPLPTPPQPGSHQ